MFAINECNAEFLDLCENFWKNTFKKNVPNLLNDPRRDTIRNGLLEPIACI